MGEGLRVLISAHVKWYNAEAEYAFRLARGLRPRGVEVLLWGLPGSPLLARAQTEGIPVITGPDPSSLNPLSWRGMAEFLHQLVRKAGITVVNAHRSEGFPLIAAAARQGGAAVVRTRGDMRPPRFAALNGFIHQRFTDFLITGSDLLRDHLLARLNLEPERVRTIRLGIRPEEVRTTADPAETRRKLGLSPHARVVGVMGRLGPVKGQEFILRAAPRVLSSFPDTVFLIIYRDIEESDLFLPAVRRAGLGRNFVFVGPGQPHREAMAVAEFGVIPSVGSEGHCRVALEWMALSKAVIGSRVGVIPEIVVHGETGFLVQPRYTDTLAHCMLELLHDPGRTARMGREGLSRLLTHFTEERMVEENLEVFRQAAARLKSSN